MSLARRIGRTARAGGARAGVACLALVMLAPGLSTASPSGAATSGVSPAPEASAAPALDPVETASVETPRSVILERQRQQTSAELDQVARSIALSEKTVRDLDAEIATIAEDRDRVRQAMIDAAAAQKQASADLQSTERRIDDLATQEGGIKASLYERRGVLAEVLGALERLGRKPPPALLVKPQDALGAVRSAILLGAVVPGLRKETETLLADLERLKEVRASIESEKQRYGDALRRHREEEARLARLFDEKQRLEAANRERREAASGRADELAAKASDLKDLIGSLQADADAARAAEEAARKEAERLQVAKLQAAKLEADRLERERRVAEEHRLRDMQEQQARAEKAGRVLAERKATERRDAVGTASGRQERLAAVEAQRLDADAQAISTGQAAPSEDAADAVAVADAVPPSVAGDGGASSAVAAAPGDAADASAPARVADAAAPPAGDAAGAGADGGTPGASEPAATEAPVQVASLEPQPAPGADAGAAHYDIASLRREVRTAHAGRPIFDNERSIVGARRGQAADGIRGDGRYWTGDHGIVLRRSSGRCGHRSGGRACALCGTLPFLRTTLDP